MNTDKKEEAELEDGFTEVQVEVSEELYHMALAAAQAEGCSLDEWVAGLLQEEVRRRASESSGGREDLTTDNHGCENDSAAPGMAGEREAEA